jgi:FkbM family methyltransferase
MKYVFAPIKKIGFINNFSLLFQRKTGKKIIEISAKNAASMIYLRNGTTDVHTFYDIFTNDEYDIDFGFTPETIIDCGANTGLVTVFYKSKYPESKIIAIEPESSNFEMLVKNTSSFNNVHCLKNAVWGNEGFIEISDPGFGNWGFMTSETDNESETSVKTVTINSIMQKFELLNIDVLKIDIEGAEKEVFESDHQEWLSKTRVILIELHDRLKPGCSTAFFKAISKLNFYVEIKGELLICKRADNLS